MADQYQTSSELTGRLNRDEDVLWRGRVTLNATNQGPSSIYAPFYYAAWSQDIDFINADSLRPEIEVWESVYDSFTPAEPYQQFRKCPYVQVNPGARNIKMATDVFIYESTTSKTTGGVLRAGVAMFSDTQFVERTFFVTVFNRTIASSNGELYPDQGTFT